MGILKFLLIVFAVFYIIILIGRFFLYRFVKKSKERFNQQANQQQERTRSDGTTYVEYQPEEKKNIPKDEGEYVDYEEIK
ncbi:MAG: DUF4834 family protein [Salinivirgaceae bacterium]|jgi:hypothetical protein|nr:DUF4834 family protein [Salinivirgaceae bacterium]